MLGSSAREPALASDRGRITVSFDTLFHRRPVDAAEIQIRGVKSNDRTLAVSSSPQLHGLLARRVPPEFLAFVGSRAFQGLSRNGFAFAVADFERVARNWVDFASRSDGLLGIDCNIHLHPPADLF